MGEYRLIVLSFVIFTEVPLTGFIGLPMNNGSKRYFLRLVPFSRNYKTIMAYVPALARTRVFVGRPNQHRVFL
jgi:hypothetical protein